ncbi:alcohol dehydrogenase catalytic domain-containing protein [Enterovirga aerilata]|uniref:Alcohol dehydrogenase catalytic domain-containing protein n=1 Tax=Enterovirga aerilata TaxID=2730920 RepID=A0A849IA10_9HYPH|nr:alcohol dehydrogenase catalytic domain-containing protein [Enterovirga sp. DB1703]
MRATILPAFGEPEVFRCEDIEPPRPRPDQLLIRVAACGVCGHDLLNRSGAFPETRLPCVMGYEIAGSPPRATAYAGMAAATTARIPVRPTSPTRR